MKDFDLKDIEAGGDYTDLSNKLVAVMGSIGADDTEVVCGEDGSVRVTSVSNNVDVVFSESELSTVHLLLLSNGSSEVLLHLSLKGHSQIWSSLESVIVDQGVLSSIIDLDPIAEAVSDVVLALYDSVYEVCEAVIALVKVIFNLTFGIYDIIEEITALLGTDSA